MASVEITGATELRLGIAKGASHANIHAFVVKPIFTHFGRMLTQSIVDEFSGLSPGGINYRGDMATQAKGNFSVKKDDTLEIGEAVTHGYYIRHGTEPWYSGTFGEMMTALRAGDRVKFPRGVFEWARSPKVGASRIGAYYIAWKVMRYGMGRLPNSPIRKRYPSGKRGFDYPNYLINRKNSKDIARGITRIGSLYADMVLG